MKNQGFKKIQTSSNNYQKLEHIHSNTIDKSDYNSVNKYNRSPYLQKVANQSLNRKKLSIGDTQGKYYQSIPHTVFRKKSEPQQDSQHQFRSFSKNSNYQLPRVVNSVISPNKKVGGFRLPRIDQQQINQFQTTPLKNIEQTTQSATLQFSSTKKKKLEPLRHQAFKCVIKTKAGTNGKQTKINQDIAFIEQKLAFGLKCYCVCDGHGLNGHIVSGYIKTHFISKFLIKQRENLTSLLKKQTSQPQFEKIQSIISQALNKTNQTLLDSEINTQLSGSTVIAVLQYKNKIFSFNVGDSRAILCTQRLQNNLNQNFNVEQKPQLQLSQSRHQIKAFKQAANNSMARIHLSKVHKLEKYSWKAKQLSIDQKPERQDQKQRILKNGGRIECNKTERGQQIGPLRVWMKDIQMPGLAMTRSFGDKAGLRAGTSAEPEIIQHQITQNDKFIVIASDGVWQYLQNQQVMNIIVPFYLREDIDMAAQKVVKLSTQIWSRVSYSRDDITVIIIALNPPSK